MTFTKDDVEDDVAPGFVAVAGMPPTEIERGKG